jgi:hypothetical protein
MGELLARGGGQAVSLGDDTGPSAPATTPPTAGRCRGRRHRRRPAGHEHREPAPTHRRRAEVVAGSRGPDPTPGELQGCSTRATPAIGSVRGRLEFGTAGCAGPRRRADADEPAGAPRGRRSGLLPQAARRPYGRRRVRRPAQVRRLRRRHRGRGHRRRSARARPPAAAADAGAGVRDPPSGRRRAA